MYTNDDQMELQNVCCLHNDSIRGLLFNVARLTELIGLIFLFYQMPIKTGSESKIL